MARKKTNPEAERAEAVEATVSAEAELLRREMLALGQLLPGLVTPPTLDEAEIESGFDNMPV